MRLQNIFKKHTNVLNARRQVVFWLTLPTVVIVMLMALIAALQSGGVMTTLRYTFDSPNHAIINHSLWWVICLNIAGAMLTIAVIIWFISLYFVYQSLHTYWRLGRPRTKKARQKRSLYWTGLAFIAVPVVLIVLWDGLGSAIQFVTAPMTQVVATSNYNTISGYWNTGIIPEAILLVLPFCLLVSIYCAVKRNRL